MLGRSDRPDKHIRTVVRPAPRSFHIFLTAHSHLREEIIYIDYIARGHFAFIFHFFFLPRPTLSAKFCSASGVTHQSCAAVQEVRARI